MPSVSKSQLSRKAGHNPDANGLMADMIEVAFNARFVPVADTALTVTAEHNGAFLRTTAATTVTVTLPTSGVDVGCCVTFIPYGAGAIAFSGSVIGGTGSSGQYVPVSAMLLDTGEWLIMGGA